MRVRSRVSSKGFGPIARRCFGVATLSALGLSAALADPATPEGAKAILDGYAAVIGREPIDKKLVTVTPDGDAYVVIWSFQPLIDARKKTHADAAQPDIAIEPFTYRLTSMSGGAWSAHADALPKIAIADPKSQEPAAMTVDFGQATMDAAFDPTAAETLKWSLAIDPMQVDFETTQADKKTTFHFTYGTMRFGLSAKPGAAAGAFDLQFDQGVGSMQQKMTTPLDGDVPIEVDVEGGAAKGAATVLGLRVQAIRDLFKAAVADHKGAAASPAVKAAVIAAFPFFDTLKATGSQGSLKVTSAMGAGVVDSIGQSLDMSGVAPDGNARFAMSFSNLKFASLIVPSWVGQAFPLSLSLDASVGYHGLDKAAAILVNQGEDGNANAAAAMMASPIEITLAPTALHSPILNLEASGSARVQGTPTGSFHLVADRLDPLAEAVHKVGLSEADAANFDVVLALAKGYAKTGDDGRLSWDIGLDGDNVTVNGKPLPKSK
jgi:hypothetical protein